MRRVETERERVRAVADRWAAQYPIHQWPDRPDSALNHKRATIAKLRAIDVETATAAEVNEIIGNDSWCGPDNCDECGVRTFDMVHIGEEPDYEARYVEVCRGCLLKMVSLIDNQTEEVSDE